MDRGEYAKSLKDNGMCNCCQAVCKAFSDLVCIKEEDLMKISSGFGQGMGTLESTCGALVGANIILGLLNNTQNGTVRFSRNLLKDFEALSGATQCKMLKGIGTGKVLCECGDCCKNASIVLEKTLKDNNLIKEEK